MSVQAEVTRVLRNPTDFIDVDPVKPDARIKLEWLANTPKIRDDWKQEAQHLLGEYQAKSYKLSNKAC
jgi:hypothetical protein